MRILKANDTILDIDSDTAIGIDLQAYDFKKPGELKGSVSNTFTIPATPRNMRFFGFAGRAYQTQNAAYGKITIEYYVNNTKYLDKGTARIEKVEGGRIHLFVAERPAFADEMKATQLNTFLQSWFSSTFLNTTYDTFADFVAAYRVGSGGVIMPLMAGNLSLYEDVLKQRPEAIGYFDGLAYSNTIAMSVQDDSIPRISMGGHFGVMLRNLLEYVETYFGVNLSSVGIDNYNLFRDPLLDELFIPVRNISYATPEGGYRLAFINRGNYYQFSPHEDLSPFDGLTVYDFFATTLKLLGYAIELLPSGAYSVVRLDLINQIIPEQGDNLPGYMAAGFKDSEFVPNIEGYGVQNLIKMKPYSGASPLLGAKNVINSNKNLDETKDLFAVQAFIPPFFAFDGVFIPNMAAPDTFSSLTFLRKTNIYKTTRVTGRWNVQIDLELLGFFPPKYNVAGQLMAPVEDIPTTLMVPEVYTVAGEYAFLDSILLSPETRKVKRWVNSSMMQGFRKVAPYYVREFGAWYFVNKISNFNPERSLEPVTFELVRLPWVREPNLPPKEIESTDKWILEDGTWNDTGIWIDSEPWKDL